MRRIEPATTEVAPGGSAVDPLGALDELVRLIGLVAASRVDPAERRTLESVRDDVAGYARAAGLLTDTGVAASRRADLIEHGRRIALAALTGVFTNDLVDPPPPRPLVRAQLTPDDTALGTSYL
jgi:hypothetical protein